MAKKFTLVLVLATVAAGWTFAQEDSPISFSAEGKAYFAPLIIVGDQQTDGEVLPQHENNGYVGAGQNWALATFGVTASNDYAGVGLAMEVQPGNVTWDGKATAWITPFGNEILKLQGGRFNEDFLRGKVGGVNSDFHNHFVLGNSGDEDSIFTRFKPRNQFFDQSAPIFATDDNDDTVVIGSRSLVGEQLFVISSKPIENLFVGVGVTAPLFEGGSNRSVWKNPRNAANVYRTTQVGVGYNIDGIGFARVQFLGGFVKVDHADMGANSDWDNNDGGSDYEFEPSLNVAGMWGYNRNATIEAAFQLKAVEPLNLDLGFKFHLPTTEIIGGTETKISNGIVVALGAKYLQGDIRVNGRIDLSAAQSFEVVDSLVVSRGMGFSFDLAPGYQIADKTWVGLDFGMKIRGSTAVERGGSTIDEKDNTFDMGFGGYFEKGVSNAVLTTGLTYTLAQRMNGEANGRGVFSVPILVKVNF